MSEFGYGRFHELLRQLSLAATTEASKNAERFLDSARQELGPAGEAFAADQSIDSAVNAFRAICKYQQAEIEASVTLIAALQERLAALEDEKRIWPRLRVHDGVYVLDAQKNLRILVGYTEQDEYGITLYDEQGGKKLHVLAGDDEGVTIDVMDEEGTSITLIDVQTKEKSIRYRGRGLHASWKDLPLD